MPPRTKHPRRYALVEDGVTDLDEVLKVRLADIKADRDRARSVMERIKGQSPAARIATGENRALRVADARKHHQQAYLRWFIDAVEVGDSVIRMHGSRVPRRPAYLDNLTLHELSRLALAVDALERELTTMKIRPLASSRAVRKLVQEHIDRMTQDDNSRKTPSAL
jgi:hypothetical protein